MKHIAFFVITVFAAGIAFGQMTPSEAQQRLQEALQRVHEADQRLQEFKDAATQPSVLTNAQMQDLLKIGIEQLKTQVSEKQEDLKSEQTQLDQFNEWVAKARPTQAQDFLKVIGDIKSQVSAVQDTLKRLQAMMDDMKDAAKAKPANAQALLKMLDDELSIVQHVQKEAGEEQAQLVRLYVIVGTETPDEVQVFLQDFLKGAAAAAPAGGKELVDVGDGFSCGNASVIPDPFNSNYAQLIGEVKNASGKSSDYCTFNVSLYDSNGRLLASGSFMVQNFHDGDTKSFQAILNVDPRQVKSWRIRFDSRL